MTHMKNVKFDFHNNWHKNQIEYMLKTQIRKNKGYIFWFTFKFNTRLTFGEGAETGCGLGSTDGGGVTGVAGSLGCSSCKEIKKQEQWLPMIVPKCLRKHTK